jgi:hypothetical protein
MKFEIVANIFIGMCIASALMLLGIGGVAVYYRLFVYCLSC